MNKVFQRPTFAAIAFDLVLLYALFELLKFFVPDIVSKVTYTYNVYYQTTLRCFPHYASLAFAVLVLLPHVILVLSFIYLYWRLAAYTGVRKYILSVFHLAVKALALADRTLKAFNIDVKEKYINIYQVYLRGYFHPTVWQQLRISGAITLFFIGLYYLLALYIPDKGRFFDAQLTLSHFFLAVLQLQLLAVLYSSRKNFLPFLKSWFSEPGSAYNLAVFRIVIGFQLWGIYFTEQNNNSYWAALPKDMRVSLPYMGWFIQNVPISPALYHYAAGLAMVCAVCIMLGFCTRLALILNIPLSIYVIGVPFFFGKLFHMHIWVWFPAILAFSSCGDVLSVDWLIKKLFGKTGPTSPHPKYRLPLALVWMHLGIIYFFPGIVKLKDCGLAWALSDSMINQVWMEWAQWYGRIPAIRVDHYPVLLHVGGMAAILFEIFYFFMIFTPWGRVFVFFGGLAMHNIIDYMMYIGFSDLQMTYVAFINWQKMADWLKRMLLKIKPAPAASLGIEELMRMPTYRRVFFTGITLFVINFTCGVFQINSWPFSSYPTYSSIVPDYRYFVYFKTYDKQGREMVVYDLGKKANFRMESYTPIEDRIYENMQAGDSVTLRRNIHKLWDIWLANVSALKDADTVAVYMRTSSIIPEKADSILDEKYLMSMKF